MASGGVHGSLRGAAVGMRLHRAGAGDRLVAFVLPGRVEALDGIRGVGMLVVLYSHLALPGNGHGYIAMETFFALSGYLITRNLLRDPLLRRFFLNRATRLLPALLVMLLVTYAARGLLRPEHRPEYHVFALAIVSATAWYVTFAGDSLAVLWHTWSLSVEETFYIAWPCCLLGLRRLLGTPWLPSLVATAGLLDYALGAALFVPHDSSFSVSYFAPHFRFGGILLGCALALHLHQSRVPAPLLARASGIPGLPVALLIAAVVADRAGTLRLEPGVGWFNQHSFVTSLPLAAAATVLLIVRSREPVASHSLTLRALAWSPLRITGVMSYSVYLWHYFVIHATIPLHDLMQARYALPLQLVVVAAIASVSFWFLERPYLRRLHGRPSGVTSATVSAGGPELAMVPQRNALPGSSSSARDADAREGTQGRGA